MDHYILKVYRRDMDYPEKIVGRIQHVSTGCERPFNNLSDLKEILNLGSSLCRRRVKREVRQDRRKEKE